MSIKLFLKILFIGLLTNTITQAQTVATLPAYESFNYAIGTKLIEDNQTAGVGSWGTAQPRTTDAEIVASPDWSSVSNLINPQGKALSFGGSGDNPDFLFTQQGGFGSNPVKIYTSFVMTATRVDLLDANAQRLIGFGRLSGSNTLFGAAHIIVRGADYVEGIATGYNLGVNGTNSTSGVTWDTTVYRKDQVLSIVLFYDAGAGSGSGEFAKLWVNPTLNGAEPVPTVVSTTVRQSNIDRIQIQQSNGVNTPNIILDELRIALSWDEVTKITNTYTWTGTTDNDWATASNWDSGIVPTSQDNVIIPASSSPIIDSTTGAQAYNITVDASATLTISAGGSLLVVGNATGDITYNVNVTDTNWHLIAPPVTTESYNDTWVLDNAVESGSVSNNNRGIATYDNTLNDATTGYWRYMQQGDNATFNNGKGYSLLRKSAGNYSFVGNYNTDNNQQTITKSISDWNLVGNPYPSYINIEEFISENTLAIDDSFESIYVWDANALSYFAVTTGYIQPGQAFFVNSALSSTTLSFTETMQSHQTGITFYKNVNSNPKIELFVANNQTKKSTIFNFYEDKTEGLDPGFDLGLFTGVTSTFSIYSHLLENNNNIAFKTQALPIDNVNDLIIPIGIKAQENTELTFSLSQFNLPHSLGIYLEDKTENRFVNLSDENSKYIIKLSESLQGTGRFYLHTNAKSLATENENLNNLSLYLFNGNVLKIKGLENGRLTLKIFNVQGKRVVSKTIDTTAKVLEVNIPKLSTGVYIVVLNTEKGKLTKKIIVD